MSSSKNKEDIRANTLKFISESRAAAAEEERETPAEPAGKPQATETQREGETPAAAEGDALNATWEARCETFKNDIEEARRIFITGEPKSRRTHIMFRPSVYAKLEEAAARDRVSVNEWINQAVVEKLERDER